MTLEEKIKNLLTAFAIGLDEKLVSTEKAVDMTTEKILEVFAGYKENLTKEQTDE